MLPLLSLLGPLIAKDQILSSMPHTAISLHVLYERLKQDSWWKPYLGMKYTHITAYR